MLEKLKKCKRGSALVFVFMLLVLFAAFTAAMMEVSMSSKGMSTAIVEVKDSQYYAEIGVGYVLRECNKISLATSSFADVPAFITNAISKGKHYVGGGGWFQVLLYDDTNSTILVKNTDFLIRVKGAAPTQLSQVPSMPGLSNFIDMAYAQSAGVETEFEMLIGPDFTGGSKGNMYFGDAGGGTNPYTGINSNKIHIESYPGTTGYLVTQDPTQIDDAVIGSGVTKKVMSPSMDVAAQTLAALGAANTLLDSYISWSSDKFTNTSYDDDSELQSISPASNADVTITATGGYGGTGQYITTGKLEVGINKTMIIGETYVGDPAVITVGTDPADAATYNKGIRPIIMKITDDVEVNNNATLRMGYGQYLTTHHDDMVLNNGSTTYIGDPTGKYFTVLQMDDLYMDHATLVLGPGIYAFSRIGKAGEVISQSSKIIMDTSHGPVYLIGRTKLHTPTLYLGNGVSIVTFKDNSIDCSTYELKTDQANASNPVGETGQKIGRIYMTNLSGQQGEIDINQAGLIGAFTQGSQATLWSGNTGWNTLSAGTYSEVDSTGKLESPYDLSPTAGTFQIWAGSIDSLSITQSGSIIAAMQIADIKNVTLANTAEINGALSTGNITGTVSITGSAKIRIDPNLNPWPPVVKQGTYHIKWKRQVK